MDNIVEKEKLLATLESRFNRHMYRHENVLWKDVLANIVANDKVMTTLYKMEEVDSYYKVRGFRGIVHLN